MTDENAPATPPDNAGQVTDSVAPPAKKPWKKPALTVYPSTAANHQNSVIPDGGVAQAS